MSRKGCLARVSSVLNSIKIQNTAPQAIADDKPKSETVIYAKRSDEICTWSVLIALPLRATASSKDKEFVKSEM